jgi:phage/plasmid primase-like uncharacterized protein
MGKRMNAVIDDVSRIEVALACIPADLQRDEWARIGAALKSELGDAGFDLFDTWSQKGESYNAAAVRSTWRSLSASGGVTISTLFFKAIEHGFDSRGGTSSTVDAAELERRRVEREQRAAKEAEDREAKARNAAALAVAVWGKATPARADHPHLMRKGVRPVETLREIDAGKLAGLIGYQPKRGDDLLAGRILIAPVKVGGKLSTLEMIDGDGRKSALAGGVKAGGYWAAQPMPKAPRAVLIGEGVSTDLSASQCSGHPAVASLSVSQLEAAARAVIERCPDAIPVILADLDKATGEPHETAVKAAYAVGARLAVPDFGANRESWQTDFNDLHASRGVDAVKAAIDAAIAGEPVQAADAAVRLSGSMTTAASRHEKARPVALLTRASDIVPESIRWLWLNWLPEGKLTLLAGSPGTGKTTLALALAATVSRGGKWPDGTECARAADVLLWSGEDNPADTIVPRLMASGADMNRIHIITGRADANSEIQPFDPSTDIPLLSERLADMGGAAMLIVDPIVSAVSGDAHRVNDVRRNLQALVDMASGSGEVASPSCAALSFTSSQNFSFSFASQCCWKLMTLLMFGLRRVLHDT